MKLLNFLNISRTAEYLVLCHDKHTVAFY